MHYFDNAATTKVDEAIAKQALLCMTHDFGNPSSFHKLGVAAQQKLTNSRKSLAKAFGCKEDEVIFTSGATESTNIALFGATCALEKRGNKIITTSIEHASVKNVMDELERKGFEVVRIKPRNGKYYAKDFIDATDDNTILVSVMHVNNLTGLVLPVAEIAKGVKQKSRNVVVHVDGVQSFCKLPFKVSRTDIDMMSVSGHKIYAPKGVGALYIKKGTKIKKHCYGGSHENDLRPGTEAVPLICAMGASVARLNQDVDKNLEHYYKLNALLKEELENTDDIRILESEDNAPYIICIAAKGVKSEIMLHFLGEKNFYVASGSACSKGKKTGIIGELFEDDKLEDFIIRISFGKDNTEDEVKGLACAVKEGLDAIIKV